MGYEKEPLKYGDAQKVVQLKMENYDLDECAELCGEDESCNFIFYTLDFDTTDDKASDIGCYLYYEPGGRRRTSNVERTKSVFCNKNDPSGIPKNAYLRVHKRLNII